MLFKTLDKPVARRRLKLSRVYFPCEFKERAGVLPEVVDVKHSLKIHVVVKFRNFPTTPVKRTEGSLKYLWVRQVWKVNCQSSVNAVA